MEILIALIVILVVAFVAIYLVDLIGPPYPIPMLLKVLIVVVALVTICERAGFLHGTLT